MKNFIFVAIFVTSVQSHAQIKEAYQKISQSVTGSAKISQPHYFPAKWEVLAQAGATLANREFKPNDSASFDAKTAAQTINAAVTVGVLDFLSVGINWDYDLKNRATYESPLPAENSKGPNDPIINLTGRAGNFDSAKIDVKLAYQPKTGDAKFPAPDKDGNALNGYRTTTLGLELDFLVTNTSQVFLLAEYSMLGEKTVIDQTTGDVLNIKELKSNFIKLGTLTEIVNDTFFGIAFSNLHQDGGRTLQNDGLSTVEASEIKATALTVTGKHEFTPNSALNIELEYVLNGSLKSSTSETKFDGHVFSASYLVRF